MKYALIGAAMTAAMLLGWHLGEWMQARLGLVVSFGLWLGAWATMQAWLHRNR